MRLHGASRGSSYEQEAKVSEHRYRGGGRGPFAELQDALGDLFGQVSEFTFGFGSERGFPRYELRRTDEGYEAMVDVPGVARDDVEVTVTGRTLTISGERREVEVPEGARTLRSERPLGPFERTIELPDEIDVQGVVAQMSDGVLRVALPAGARARGRVIEIEAE